MANRLRIVDFHAHLQDSTRLKNLCPEERKTHFFRATAPLLEKFANFSEPVHDSLTRHMAMNCKGSFPRFMYGSFGGVGLMETLRLFKKRDLKCLLNSMDQNGIDHVVVCSLEPLTVTSELIEMTRPYRDRISIFVSVDKAETEPVKYVQSLMATGHIAGLKIHPIVGGYACGELYEKTKDIVALTSQADLPVVIHTGHIPVQNLSLNGCSEVQAIEPLIAAFPSTTFVLAHIGWESWRQVLALATKYDNVSVETSWQPAKIIRRAVDMIGPRRVLFGSDYPLIEQSLALRQVKEALTEREFALVASENAIQLLKLKSKLEVCSAPATNPG